MKRLDPRTKMYMIIAFVITTLASWKYITSAVSLALALVVVIVFGKSIRSTAKSVRGAFVVDIIIAIILSYVFDILVGGLFLIKFTSINAFIVVMIKSIRQSDLADVYAKGFGINPTTAKKLAIITDFLPQIGREKEMIKEASRAKGVAPESGFITDKIKRRFMMYITALHRAHVHGIRQSKNMEMRLYDTASKRNRIKRLKFGRIDTFVMILTVFYIALIVFLMVKF